MPAVVFVTAYDQYAVQAFEVNAVDYLLKPFDGSRLLESLERARGRLAQPATLIRQLEGLIEAHGSPWLQRLVVRNGEHFDFVPVDSIDWIESANNYTVLHCRGKSFVFSESLTALEHRLDPNHFLRVHRCHLVNLARIVGGELDCRRRVRTGTARRHHRPHRTAVRRCHPQAAEGRALSPRRPPPRSGREIGEARILACGQGAEVGDGVDAKSRFPQRLAHLDVRRCRRRGRFAVARGSCTILREVAPFLGSSGHIAISTLARYTRDSTNETRPARRPARPGLAVP